VEFHIFVMKLISFGVICSITVSLVLVFWVLMALLSGITSNVRDSLKFLYKTIAIKTVIFIQSLAMSVVWYIELFKIN